MRQIEEVRAHLVMHRYRWLVTGAAGFIGSHLTEALLLLGQQVTGLDNFSTGHPRNLSEVRRHVGPEAWSRFRFQNDDIRDIEACRRACEDVQFVLHEAALGSVSRSIDDPLATHESNVTGFLNVLLAARDAEVTRFVYAASSSTYGDHPALPKVEERIGRPLSPYAVSKLANELYADTFSRCYGLPVVGLRYFNVFGPRQDPAGAYAAVIPQWLSALIANEAVFINGDGESSRDFCYIANVVQANLMAAMSDNPDALNEVYNVALGERTTLLQLYQLMRDMLQPRYPHLSQHQPQFRGFRAGDVRHSQADIGKARRILGYEPTHRVQDGLIEAMDWYVRYLDA
ncbi:SDR family oxidoreductase [Massilia endophytica]|uniref:SDR family oxidoreductase n=1 Tax=Massilia endophytica TaxID=2899220 RepID=UPI001E596A0F|nr:SDR family oxidoreductase [Massilia endophytica]UGQ46228.1 SDR family oxidoreductase [Massilia endophytica]